LRKIRGRTSAVKEPAVDPHRFRKNESTSSDGTGGAMRAFVYEFVTASGIGRAPDSADHSLYTEGRAMRDALAADLTAAGHAVTISPEPEELADDEPAFRALAAACEVAFVIAPETGDWLRERSRLAAELGARVIGPSSDAIRLCGSKSALAHHWHEAGVRAPRTGPFGAAWDAFPAVLKPDHGAGSQHTYLLNSRDDVSAAYSDFHPAGTRENEMVFTEFVPGRAASVAFLCGPRGTVPLVPAFQHLSADGRFGYEGGELPIPPDLAARAAALGRAATDCVPGLCGYVGVDLVLGDAPDGSGDFAIEINPRLTTSYTGLRALADFNLADALLRVALGEAIPEPRWKPGRVAFGANGSINLADGFVGRS
jgi:predicted ATP-grasp superfamily ATP-dependent carboligase